MTVSKSSVEIVAQKLENTDYQIDFDFYKELSDTYNVVIIRCSSDDLVYFFMPGECAEETYHGESFVIPGYVGTPFFDDTCGSFVREMFEAAAEYAGAPHINATYGEYEGKNGYHVYMSSGIIPNEKFSIVEDGDFYGYGLVMSYEYLKKFIPLSDYIAGFVDEDPHSAGRALAVRLGY